MKHFFFPITWLSGFFRGKETGGKQKGRQAWFLLLSGIQTCSSLRRKEVAQTAQAHFPNKLLVINPIFCQTFLYLFSSPLSTKISSRLFWQKLPNKIKPFKCPAEEGKKWNCFVFFACQSFESFPALCW